MDRLFHYSPGFIPGTPTTEAWFRWWRFHRKLRWLWSSSLLFSGVQSMFIYLKNIIYIYIHTLSFNLCIYIYMYTSSFFVIYLLATLTKTHRTQPISGRPVIFLEPLPRLHVKLIIWLLQQGTTPVPDVVDLYYKVVMAFLKLGRY